MKKIIILIIAAATLLTACKEQSTEQKVMARFVPERLDDFVWENNLICYRAYGEALEGNPTSPGFDIWVKLPGKLVADEWYAEASKPDNGNYYHHDHGGKDCYKVATSLGAGASSPIVDGKLYFPTTNYRSWEIISQTPDEITFVLSYPAWDVNGIQVSLDKQITVSADSYFCKVVDTYKGEWEDELWIAAGINRHDVVESYSNEGRLAIWEHASDQSIEPEDGMIGVALYMPGCDSFEEVCEANGHALCYKAIKPGDKVEYFFGSCWSKGDITTSEGWFKQVAAL